MENKVGEVKKRPVIVIRRKSDVSPAPVIVPAAAPVVSRPAAIVPPKVQIVSHLDAPRPKVGDMIQWVSQGTPQFPDPKRVVAVNDGWAFVEGSGTGLPFDQVRVVTVQTAVPGVEMVIADPEDVAAIEQARAERRAKGEPDRVREEGEHGAPFIRMLNNMGLVRAVSAGNANDLSSCQVPDRLCDGYHFIVGEPAIPRETGDVDRCDNDGKAGWATIPHIVKTPESILGALKYWLRRMEEDRRTFRDREELLYDMVDVLRDRVRREIERAG